MIHALNSQEVLYRMVWKGAIIDSFRRILKEHFCERVAFRALSSSSPPSSSSSFSSFPFSLCLPSSQVSNKSNKHFSKNEEQVFVGQHF